jgi:methionine sulfoxide reductase heme-binding subunit
LHTTGMHFFWLAFTLEFSLRISQSMLIYLPLVILLVLAILLRLVAPRMQRKFAS